MSRGRGSGSARAVTTTSWSALATRTRSTGSLSSAVRRSTEVRGSTRTIRASASTSPDTSPTSATRSPTTTPLRPSSRALIAITSRSPSSATQVKRPRSTVRTRPPDGGLVGGTVLAPRAGLRAARAHADVVLVEVGAAAGHRGPGYRRGRMKGCAEGTQRARTPTTSSRSSRSTASTSASAWCPDWNVAPTKDVPAVITRRDRDAEEDAPPGPPAPAGALGSGAVVGQGPVDRLAADQRPHGDRRPRSRPSGGPSPSAAACCRPTATTSGTPRGARQEAAVLHLPAGTATRWRWPGSTSSGATRPPTPRTATRGCGRATVLTTDGRGRRRAASTTGCRSWCAPDRWAEWLDPANDDTDAAAAPAGPRRSRARSPRGRSRPWSTTCRNNGPELVEPLAAEERPAGRAAATGRPMTRSSEPRPTRTAPSHGCVATPARRRPALAAPAARAAARLLVVGHGAGRGADTADLLALAAEPARAPASRWSGSTSRGCVAGRKVAGTARPARRRLAGGRAAGPGAARPRGSRSSSAGAARGRGWPAVRRPRSAPSAVVALAFPLHPPGRPEQSRADELLGVRGADAGRPGRAGRVRRAVGGRGPRCRPTARTPDRRRRGPVRRPLVPGGGQGAGDRRRDPRRCVVDAVARLAARADRRADAGNANAR